MAFPCLSVLFALFFFTGSAFGQSTTEGFISIDCGVSSGYSYADTTTKITYVSDDQFTDAGVNSKIADKYINSVSYQDQTLRSFPNGSRNCYTLNTTYGNKYFLRATFLYGNYDGLLLATPQSPILFDLHLGVNIWARIKISDFSTEYKTEAITVSQANTIYICLVNIGKGTPFISTLEMRPVNSNLYPESVSGTSISFLYRFNYGVTNQIIRYPDDLLDRVWIPYPSSSSDWNSLSVTANSPLKRFSNDKYQAPNIVYETGVTPKNSPNLTALQYIPENTSISYYHNFYICELRKQSSNDSTQFSIYLNDGVWLSYSREIYLEMDYIYTTRSWPLDQIVFVFSAFANSTMSPIVNGAEIFSLFTHTVLTTDSGDVDAINEIKVQYGLKKNWMGDPCNPSQFAWEGLKCSYPTSGQPTIVSVNLSSSGLNGTISTSFNQFQGIKNLDLSCNNLSGAIPGFLGYISTLQFLDLRGNNFVGSIPDTLQKKNNSGSLSLITGKCVPPTSNSKNNNSSKKTAIAIAIPASLIVIVVLIVIMFLFLKKNKQQEQTSQQPNPINLDPAMPIAYNEQILNPAEVRQYTYIQIDKITNNFSKVIGEGGFGKVYYGLIENGKEVAVKLSSQAANQHVVKQFLAEANNLVQVHHKNLVSLVGYCRDGKYVALLYDYMANGSLYDHLRGKPGIARALSWPERVRIALEAAQGLHYLHTGRNMIHRDVKSSNILLGKKLEAKVADFGLSKIFSEGGPEQTATLCGTPGYIDPEGNMTQILNDKSDVYSFGVVLLEIVTGKPPIITTERENVSIIQYVKQRIYKGDISEVSDPRLRGEYDQNSIWKVVDLAMYCTSAPASERPTMADVVKQLQDSLEIENKPRNNVFHMGSTNTRSSSQTSAMDVLFSSYEPAPR